MIFLSVYNAILVPFEFAFPLVIINNPYLDSLEYTIDTMFATDVFFNFRVIYYDSKIEENVTDDRKIAINYVLRGRFVIDFVATLPVEMFFGQSDENQ